RDIRLLKKMEAYQAAWMIKQVDLTGRSDVTLVDQDGLSYSKGDDDMHVMAPLAKKAYKRLSWNRTRTLDPLSPTQALALRGKQSAETIGISGSSSSGSAYAPDDLYYGGWERIWVLLKPVSDPPQLYPFSRQIPMIWSMSLVTRWTTRLWQPPAFLCPSSSSLLGSFFPPRTE